MERSDLTYLVTAATVGGAVSLIFWIVRDWLVNRNKPKDCDNCKCFDRIEQCEADVRKVETEQIALKEREDRILHEIERSTQRQDKLVEDVGAIKETLAGILAVAQERHDRMLFQKTQTHRKGDKL